ncbi:uncharacterized protein LOC132631220 [Lycium barbarum]|uniref:uncharacterized protein LOC132631220 n=1 Tax=Lycium barbarum TaxID=112863 RepID=UPI00293E3CB0|nr:uncharacterized protein LOC132631220 [Lycium barbarum]
MRACAIDFESHWDEQLPLVEFASNNSYQSSIEMAPYETLYGRRCRSPVGWFELGERKLLGPEMVQQALDKVKVIQNRLKTTQSRQKSYSDKRVCDLKFMEGDMVLLKVSPMKEVHSIFHVSMLRKYSRDLSHTVQVIDHETVHLDQKLAYEEVPIAILDRQVRQLRSKSIPSVKIL